MRLALDMPSINNIFIFQQQSIYFRFIPIWKFKNYNFFLFSIIRIMSLLRKNNSKSTLRLTTEDFTSAMDQKLNIIASLKAQVDSLRVNQQKYERVKEQLAKAKSKYEYVLRDHQTAVFNNEQRLQLSARNVYELRIQAEHLEQQLKMKAQALKQAKFNTQQLIEFENKKEDESTQIKIKFQEMKSLGQVRKMQEQRTRLQIAQLKQQVEKGKRQISMCRNQTQNINQKSYKTQSYIRSLLREQTHLNQNLSKVQDENKKLDKNISELDTIISINNSEISNKEKDCEQWRFHIASKEIQKKKLENQIRQKVKQLSLQKQKWRNLCQDWEQKKYDFNRCESQIQEASTEINFIIAKNNEIGEVNQQLKEDLKVCERHLQNVSRVNKLMDSQIQVLRETNLKAIKKLQEPFSNRTNFVDFSSNSFQKWGNSSRATNFETNDFEKKSCK